MTTRVLMGALLASVMIFPAVAQSTGAPEADRPAAKADAPNVQGEVWRASKLKGLNVYNEQNEKLGTLANSWSTNSGRSKGS